MNFCLQGVIWYFIMVAYQASASLLTFSTSVHSGYRVMDINAYVRDTQIQHTNGISHETILQNTTVDVGYHNDADEYAIMYVSKTVDIPLYDLRARRVGVVNQVLVDCYDTNDCDYTITEYDKKVLTLYASMVNTVGGYHVPQSFDIGVIRAHNAANTIGRFTISMDNRVTCWIRLRDDANNELYREGDILQRMLLILEVAAHERAHYEEPYVGHGDLFQISYNTLMGNAIHRVREYEALATHVIGNVPMQSSDNVALIIVAVLFAIGSVVFCVWTYRSKERDNEKRESRYAKV